MFRGSSIVRIPPPGSLADDHPERPHGFAFVTVRLLLAAPRLCEGPDLIDQPMRHDVIGY